MLLMAWIVLWFGPSMCRDFAGREWVLCRVTGIVAFFFVYAVEKRDFEAVLGCFGGWEMEGAMIQEGEDVRVNIWRCR